MDKAIFLGPIFICPSQQQQTFAHTATSQGSARLRNFFPHIQLNVKLQSVARAHRCPQALAMSSLRKHIGARVKIARQRAGLSQEALAERIEKSRETISILERGEGLAALDILDRLAEELGVETEFFVASFDSERTVSRSRQELELKILGAISNLSDRDLLLLADLAASMHEHT